MVICRHDGYAMELDLRNLLDEFKNIRSSRSIDVMYQLFDDPVI
jgi:hypothetical protein